MTRGPAVLVGLLAGAIGLGLGLLGQHWLNKGANRAPGLDRGAQRNGDGLGRLPEFRLPDLAGHEVSSHAWTGKVLVLNYWATWCPPCLHELPLFAQVQREHGDGGLQVVGIAIDEKENVARFLADHPVNYPILLGEAEAIALSLQLGNRLQGLPFTAIFDRSGKRVYAQAGEMTQDDLTSALAPLLAVPVGAQTNGN